MLSYFFGSKPTAPQSRPIETFQELFQAIHVMSKLKATIFGGNSPEAATQSTKIAILQALMSNVGHEGVAAQESLEDLQETLEKLSEKSLREAVDNEGEIGLERRRLVRRILGVILKNDATITAALRDLGQSEDTINGLLMESDYAMLFETLNAMELEDQTPAMKAIKAYLVSARTILHEAQFGLFEELDFVFPNEIRLAPSPEVSRREEDAAAAAPALPPPPPPLPLPPTAQERALKSYRKAAAGGDSRIQQGEHGAFTLQGDIIREIQAGRVQLRQTPPRTTPLIEETDKDRHLRAIREEAAKRQARSATDQPPPVTPKR